MALTRPDSPLLCHYFCHYLKWVYNKDSFIIENILNFSYGGLGGKISDLLLSEQYEGESSDFHQVPKSQHTGQDYFMS